MQVEIGDRVRIKHEAFPDDHETHIGWEPHEYGPGWGAPITKLSSEHWEGAQGVVVGLDTLNNEVNVRGQHLGENFTLILPESLVEVREQGIPR